MADTEGKETVVNGRSDEQIDDDTDDGHSCGWGPVRPRCCRWFRDPKWLLFFMCWLSMVQGMVVNGFVNVVISNIERRFEISSTESGTIASCYDIASVLLLIPITYFGGFGNKPRYLGIGAFVMGVGSFIFALPHFTTDVYSVKSTQENTCHVGGNATDQCSATSPVDTLSNYKYVFFLGQLLHGAGACPLYTLGVVYLDENVSVRSSPLYVGIFYTAAIIGPAVGYLLGGQFLNIFTDPGASQGLTPDNPRWVGAWWIGFLITGSLAVMVSAPLAAFPRTLPGYKKYKKERGKEAHHNKSQANNPAMKEEHKKGLKDILLSAQLLLTNPTFMFINLAAATEAIVVAGLSTFSPKFLESQYSLAASSAAMIVGYATVPGGGGGMFVGGIVLKRFNLKVRGILRLCIVVTVITALLAISFIINCPNVAFAGVNRQYKDATGSLPVSGKQLSHACNSQCGCTEYDFYPVCGRDNVMYFSPCYAGCQVEITTGVKRYNNCSCITTTETDYMAEAGKCEAACGLLPVFMPIFAIMIFLTFLISMPALQVTLRCVPEHQRSFAMGIQWILARCLGSIPGPILFGKLIDLTCTLWQLTCNDGDGSCFFYDNKQLSTNMLILAIAIKVLSAIFFSLAYFFYKKPPGEDTEGKKDGNQLPVSTLSSSQSALVPHDELKGTPDKTGVVNGGAVLPSSSDSTLKVHL